MEASKHWYESTTIWGSLLAATAAMSTLSAILPGAETQQDFAGAVIQLLGAAGSLLAVNGRITARKTIM